MSLFKYSEIDITSIRKLSDSWSINSPNFETRLYFRAIKPSKPSITNETVDKITIIFPT